MASRPPVPPLLANPDSAKLIATLIDTQAHIIERDGDAVGTGLAILLKTLSTQILDMHNVKSSGNGASSAHSWEN